MPFRHRSVLSAAAALSLLAAGIPAWAAQQAHGGNALIVGIAYVPPPYQADKKFRTPEAIDSALAESVAKAAEAPLKTVRAVFPQGSRLLDANKLDALVLPAISSSKNMDRITAIPTGYSARPMAIMRTDTTIKTPEQLRGRKVCIAESGRYAGTLASKYGAVETVTKAPADSLLAVRIGTCDAAVHDSAILEELIKLPEWKKFSASLYLGPAAEQHLVVRRDDAKTLHAVKKAAGEWQRTDFINQEIRRMVRHIAFEVYLDQNVPDCH
ncbi:MAG: ABC transporter substrate-binding protein [Burkholderiaceae bacterium]